MEQTQTIFCQLQTWSTGDHLVIVSVRDMPNTDLTLHFIEYDYDH